MSLLDHLMMYKSPAPITMLANPIVRSWRSFTVAMVTTKPRQRPGFRNGIMPSITSIKQKALPNSSHITHHVTFNTSLRHTSPIKRGFTPQMTFLAAFYTKKPGTGPGDFIWLVWQITERGAFYHPLWVNVEQKTRVKGVNTHIYWG